MEKSATPSCTSQTCSFFRHDSHEIVGILESALLGEPPTLCFLSIENPQSGVRLDPPYARTTKIPKSTNPNPNAIPAKKDRVHSPFKDNTARPPILFNSRFWKSGIGEIRLTKASCAPSTRIQAKMVNPIDTYARNWWGESANSVCSKVISPPNDASAKVTTLL